MLELGTLELVIGILGHLSLVGIARFIYRDAVRNDIGRPWFWTAICCGAFILGVWLFVFTDAPITGIILTSNTGFVLYGYEREVSRERGPGRQADGPLQE